MLSVQDVSMFNFQNIMYALFTIAAIVTAVTVVINAVVNVRVKTKDYVSTIVEASIKAQQVEVTKIIDNSICAMQNHTNIKFEMLDRKIETYIGQEHTHRKERQKELDEVIHILKASHIETYKNDIRSIYYRLRDTGEILDYDKAYIDKIYPLYISLGGNSDIQAKYAEIGRVYQRITEENFDKARERQKQEQKLRKEKAKLEADQNKKDMKKDVL